MNKKVVIFLFMLMASCSLFAASSSKNQESIIKSLEDLKNIQGKLLLIDDDKGINQLLEKRIKVLDNLMVQLRAAKKINLPEVYVNRDLGVLESRIEVNTEKGNRLAALRDQVKLETYKTKQAIRDYLQFLIKASKKYQTIEEIVSHSQTLLDELVENKKKIVLPKDALESQVFVDLKKNYQQFLLESNSYQDILMHVISYPRQISSVHWFQEFSLFSAISYVNHFDVLQPINNRLAPFKIDVGAVVVSFIIIFLIYFTYPVVFKATGWCIENFVIDKDSEHQEMIYHEIRKPIRALLIFFGVNLGTYAFFYKTDYRSSLEGFSYIVYSFLLVWLLFKIVNSLVLVQIDKLSNSNKDLRKGLFNLGVQTGKGIIVIIVLAFGLNHFGISLTAIISTLGVGGLAFALAAKDTLSNLFGGITIILDNVFRMGDWVKVGDAEGTVAEIGLRSTTIRTFDNALITIPNSLVSVSSVKNWNRRAVGRRIKMYIGVTYESNMDDVRQGLEDIRQMLRDHPDIANPKQTHIRKKKNFKFSSPEDSHGIKATQLVFMDRYNDFSIDILLYCFSKTVNWAEWLAVKEDVLFKIAEILKKNNLEFAYPTQVRIYRTENSSESESRPLFDQP